MADRGVITMWSAFAAGGVYAGWSVTTLKGLGGWISRGQAMIFGGSTSPKLSFFLTMSIVALAVVAGASLVARLMGTTLDGPRSDEAISREPRVD